MNQQLIQNLLTKFAQADEQTAFSIYDGEKAYDVSYRQFLQDVLRAGGFFRAQHIRHQHIALAAANSYEWLVVFLSVLASGNVAVLLNPELSAEQIDRQCSHADVSFIWCDDAVETRLERLDCARMLAAEPMAAQDAACMEPDETVVLLGTSGTTGKSKMVEISARNLQSGVESYTDLTPVSDIRRFFLPMPLHHIGGAIISLMIFSRQLTLCLGRGMRYLLADMPFLNPTYVSMVPAMAETLERLLRNATDPEKRAQFIGSCLRRIYIGGAAPKASTCRSFASQGLVLETGYGMTETCGNGPWCELNEDILGTVGKLHGNIQCCIKDGEILFKGPSVMKGYYKDPEETAKVIDADGWLHSGDMGRCDENGYYYVTGRIKNVIILSNGENVNPEEIEAELGKCSAIRECMVYSDGKGICADVYTEDEEEARLFIRQYNENMPMYRQVYKVLCQGEPLEKTPTGKIKRKENR